MARLSRLNPSFGRLAPLISKAPHQAGREPSQQRDRSQGWRKWYKLERWRKLRISIFIRDRFTCQMSGCGRIEGNTSLLVCDHKKPHRGHERLFWDQGNLQTLCKECHDTLKQKEEQSSLHQRGVWD